MPDKFFLFVDKFGNIINEAKQTPGPSDYSKSLEGRQSEF